jgi:hypothetical protein
MGVYLISATVSVLMAYAMTFLIKLILHKVVAFTPHVHEQSCVCQDNKFTLMGEIFYVCCHLQHST